MVRTIAPPPDRQDILLNDAVAVVMTFVAKLNGNG
jgi:hypothetical protein